MIGRFSLIGLAVWRISDCAQVFSALGLGLTLWHSNQSKRKSLQHYYFDRESIEMVADIFAEDIEYLGYEFEDLPLR